MDGGCVRLSGVDLRDLDPSWLRSHVLGLINQEPVLFATSIMENIRYGRPSATDQAVSCVMRRDIYLKLRCIFFYPQQLTVPVKNKN